MHKRPSKLHLHKLVNQDIDSDDILHSHAYRKVEKKHGPSVPTVKRTVSSHSKATSNYKHSMVGSIAQYHDTKPMHPKKDQSEQTVQHQEDVVGNRPRSGTHDAPKNDQASIERRHHFIEPSKRNFHKFD